MPPVARYRPAWSSLVGCLWGGLAALGHEHDEPWVAGLSGCAFLSHLPPELCDGGPRDWAPVVALARNLGRRLDWLRRSQEMGARVRAELEAGRPLILRGLQRPEFYLLHGCGEAGFYFDGPAAGQSAQPQPWAALQREDLGGAVFFGPPYRAAPAEAVRAALRFAVERAGGGLAGYARWAGALRDPGLALDPWGLAYSARLLYEARTNAAAFLPAAAGRLGPDPLSAALREAAACYYRAAEALGEVVRCFPLEAGAPSPEQRTRAAALLDRAARSEAEGAALLEDAL